ncbi:PHP domain-containing protein [Ruminococcus sp. NK3A76]|uniref:PHP domain-containing protein n=1 Tax=Ruminococcus sp. NK3A76 TaxID=877411 RepID=UPI00048E5001|nr:PHP domain-containing protein [Ruminococcus sp. NK3A76]
MIDRRHIELNVHSNGALYETVITPEDIVAFAVRNGSNAVAITDLNSVSSAAKMARVIEKNDLNIKPIYGVRLHCLNVSGEVFYVTLLAKNKTGLKNMYRIISLAYCNVLNTDVWPCADWQYVLQNREGILIGRECTWEFINNNCNSDKAVLKEKLNKLYENIDYAEITPLCQSSLSISENDMLKCTAHIVIDLLQQIGKTPVAVSSAACITEEDKLCWNILHQDDKDKPYKPGCMKTTEDMLEEYSFLGELAERIVIDNTIFIADSIETFELTSIPEESRITFPNAENEVKERCLKAAKDKYGEPLPDIIKARLADEFRKIEASNSWAYFLLTSKLTGKCAELGGLHICRGTANSSFAAYLLGITDTNPLPPHYWCPKCKRVEFVDERKYPTGFDLVGYGTVKKLCPECSIAFRGEGINSPCEFFMGYNGERETHFELSVSEDSYKGMVEYIDDLFGKDKVFYRAPDSTIGEKDSSIMIEKYCNKDKAMLSYEKIECVTERLRFVNSSYGTGPKSLFIVPDSFDIYDFTPVGYSTVEDANKGKKLVVLMENGLLVYGHNNKVLHIFKSRLLSMLKQLEKYTGIPSDRIDIGSVDIKSFFENDSLGGFYFNTPFIKEVIAAVKPADFNDLVKIAGFVHGTQTWENNAEQLIRQGHTAKELISSREDIMLTLMKYGIDYETSFAFSEYVKFGKASRKGFSDEQLEIMRKNSVPEWYIESMKKILHIWSKSYCAAITKHILQCVWYKINYPTEFYAADKEAYR